MIPKFFNGCIIQEVGKIEFFSTYCVVTDKYFGNTYPTPYDWLFCTEEQYQKFKKELENGEKDSSD